MSELILKDKPVGIDTVINNINDLVFSDLDWKSTSEFPVNYTAYHRALKNPRGAGLVPEVYEIEKNTRYGEYKEAFYDDTIDASSFFYTSDSMDTVDNGRLFNTTLSMVFQVDLSKVANNIYHRGDAEIQRIVVNAINKGLYGKVSNVVTGVSSVYSEFDQSQIQFTDMHPFHCFRVDIDVNYELDCCVDGCGLQSNGFLLLESGGYILLEDGGKIIIE
jgi:hypothetical protein